LEVAVGGGWASRLRGTRSTMLIGGTEGGDRTRAGENNWLEIGGSTNRAKERS